MIIRAVGVPRSLLCGNVLVLARERGSCRGSGMLGWSSILPQTPRPPQAGHRAMPVSLSSVHLVGELGHLLDTLGVEVTALAVLLPEEAG